jgi:hypothetical protein
VFGPVESPGIAEPVTVDSWYPLAERQIYGPQPGVSWDPESEENKGEVLGGVLRAVLGRMQSANAGELPLLLRTLQSLVQQRQVLVVFHDAGPAALATRYEADGRFAPPPSGDVLSVIDANLSYSKVAAYIDEQIEYDVWLDRTGLPISSRVTVSYTNRLTRSEAADPARRIGGAEFDPIARAFRPSPGLYGAYARVYVPAKSRLTGADPPESEILAGTENGFLSLERFERIPPESSRRFSYTYQIPTDRREPGVYRLRVIKQPGTAGHAIVVRVHLPDGLDASPSLPMERDGDALVFRGRLDRSLDLALDLNLP